MFLNGCFFDLKIKKLFHLHTFLKSLVNPFVDIALTFSDNSFN